MSGLLRKLNTTALAPMSAFLALLQDCESWRKFFKVLGGVGGVCD